MRKAQCKIDYGQFEFNKTYEYSYTIKNNIKKYFVKGLYGDNEFNQKQFNTIFETKNNNKLIKY